MARILIVDEAELFRRLERTFLRRAGFDLHAASTPEDLLTKARALRPDLILLHARRAGGRCGVPCARTLGQDPATASIPVVLVTEPGTTPPADLAARITLVPSPVDPRQLAETVCRRLGTVARGAARHPVRVAVRVRSEEGTLRGLTKDLSAEGLFLPTPRPPAAGARVRVRVTLPRGEQDAEVVDADGIVVRSIPDDPGSYLVPGAGLRFVDLPESGRRTLEEFLDRRGAAS
jgi:uncharacterized protein (TIGR02266 family)